MKDCLNAIKHLNNNGIIFFHDFLPRSYYEERVPRIQSNWTGDVWKVGWELHNSRNVDFKIINIDQGIGVLKVKKNFEYLRIDDLEKKSFDDFLVYKKKLPIISSEYALDFIMKN